MGLGTGRTTPCTANGRLGVGMEAEWIGFRVSV